jgi:hypothetical protein
LSILDFSSYHVLQHTFEQKSKRKYTNELSSNIAGHRTSVVTDLKLADGEYDIITDINMAGKKPVHMEQIPDRSI